MVIPSVGQAKPYAGTSGAARAHRARPCGTAPPILRGPGAGAIAGRYSFDVGRSHPFPPAGLSRRNASLFAVAVLAALAAGVVEDGKWSQTPEGARSPQPSLHGLRAVPGHAFPRSMRERQTGLTSPTCRTPPGQSAGTRRADPGTLEIRPGFDVTSTQITAPQQRSHHRDCAPSSRSLPDASRAPFPRRSPRQSSANAARGGLKPPPAGRLRRAMHLHLSHSTASRNLAYMIKLLSAFVAHPEV